MIAISGRVQLFLQVLVLAGFGLSSGQLAGQSLAPAIMDDLPHSVPYQIQAVFSCDAQSNEGYVMVDVLLDDDHYLYSLTQPDSLATKMEFSLSSDLKVDGPLRPATPPKITELDPVLGGRSEKHFKKIAFVLPIRRISGANLENCRVDVRINGQVCSERGTCQLIRNKVIPAVYTAPNQTLIERLAQRPPDQSNAGR